MYKLKIDKKKCIGCGTCSAIAPATFKMKGNKAEVRLEVTDDESVKDANEACPSGAISFEVVKGKTGKKKETIADIIKNNPGAEEILNQEGMMCAGCPFAVHESLEDGAAVHGLRAEDLVKKIKKNKSKK